MYKLGDRYHRGKPGTRARTPQCPLRRCPLGKRRSDMHSLSAAHSFRMINNN
ncbi:hypothetical protein IQ06DRAFT_31323 [Phaeosphaeriaceae sp. SRC1lsM3a]|nr:hypothetical protein IQ06DRAFT_31323 [Stagonospora sp. SRC1lsM3a]